MHIEDFFIEFLHFATKLGTHAFDFLAEFGLYVTKPGVHVTEPGVHVTEPGIQVTKPSVHLFFHVAEPSVHLFKPMIHLALQLIQRITKSSDSPLEIRDILSGFSKVV